MPQSRTKQYGAETWAKGTSGLRGDPHTDQATILNLRQYADGSIGLRPEWEEGDTVTLTDGVVFPARYLDQSDGLTAVEWEGFVVVKVDRVSFFKWGTTSEYAYAEFLTISTNTGLIQDKHSPVTQISDYEWLVGNALIGLVSSVGPSLPHNDIAAVEAGGALMIRQGFATGRFDVLGSAIHQGRAFYWGPQISTTGYHFGRNRVYFSDYLDYDTFTSADQYFDVDGTVGGCISVGSSLFIWTEHGEWTVMQGSGPPEQQTFNSLGKAKVPAPGRWPAKIDTTALFLSSDELSLCAITANGTIDDIALRHLGSATDARAYSAGARPSLAASSLYNTTLHAGPDTPYHNLNGVWTQELYGNIVTTDITVAVSEYQALEMLVSYDGTDATIYTRDIVVGTPDQGSGDENLRGSILLPRTQVQKERVKIRSVVVNCQLWASASLSLRVGYPDGTTDALTLEANTSLTAADGEPRRLWFYLPDGAGFTTGVNLQLYDMDNIVVETVEVHYDSEKDLY